MTRYGGHTYCSNVYPQQFLLNYYEERGQQLGLFGNRFHATTNNRSYIVFCTSLENFRFSLFLLTSTQHNYGRTLMTGVLVCIIVANIIIQFFFFTLHWKEGKAFA